MADEDEQLRNIASQRAKRKSAGPARLGDALSELMEDRIRPQQSRFEMIAGLWSQLLPAELCEHCRIVDVSGGRLKVLVDSPSYANELRWCSSELLGELQRQCPHVRIKEIKFAIG